MNTTLQEFTRLLDDPWSFARASDTELVCRDHHLTVSPGLDSDAICTAELSWPFGPDPNEATPAAKLCEAFLGDATAYPLFSSRACPHIAVTEGHSEVIGDWELTASCVAGRFRLLLKNRPAS